MIFNKINFTKMKKIFLILITAVLLNSCINDELDFPGGNSETNYTILQGNLDTRTLVKTEKYLIKGQVFVNEGKVLTIQPGTVIFGDKRTKGTLIISKGAKIVAEGTAAEPIVFTSALPTEGRERGDWGGLVILGNAAVNQSSPLIEGINPPVVYGGNDPNDNSGILKYVRVEYAGIELTPNNETNSITMGGVGKGTIMEYCQVSYGGDDGFEWFGGNVDGKYFIALGMWDDCYDIDSGWSGHLQFALSVRFQSSADQSGSNIIETDSGPNDNAVPFLTNGVISNLTGIGPVHTSTANGNSWSYPTVSSNYQHAIDMRRRTALTIANSVFIGMPMGIRMNQASVYQNYTNGQGFLLNNILSAPRSTYLVASGQTAFTSNDLKTFWENSNTTSTSGDLNAYYASLGLNQNIFYGSNPRIFYAFNPNFEVTSGLLTSGASFVSPKLQNPFFQNVAFRGAFGTTDWTNGWAEFVPDLKSY
jgi:hypothetical protein